MISLIAPGSTCPNAERQGQPIGGDDVLIAGHARGLGLIVVTNNLREFSRVEGLRAEDWLAPV